MKLNRISAATIALFGMLCAACGTGTNSGNTASTGSGSKAAAGDEGKAGTENTYKDLIGTNAGEYEGVLDKLLKKAGATDAEIMEISSNYRPARGVISTSNTYTVQLVNPSDKNKIVEYRLDGEKGTITGPSAITLSQGVGSNEKFVDTYDGFKDHLFKKSDLDFSKVPVIWKDALDRSAKEYNTECYVNNVDVEMKEIGNKMRPYYYVRIQSTRSITASKSYYYDGQGNYVDY